MAKKIKIFESISFGFCLLFSVLNHFLYDWSGQFVLFAPFVPVSESVWEHGKLLFMPFAFFAIIEYFCLYSHWDKRAKKLVFSKETNSFLKAKSLPLSFCIPLMIVSYYTYTGAFGIYSVVIDILLAVVIVALMGLYSYFTLAKSAAKKTPIVYISISVAIFVMLIVFTFVYPKLPLFISNA